MTERKLRSRIRVLTTGGTIAGRANDASDSTNYTAGSLTGADLLAACPALNDIAELEIEEIAATDSKDMTLPLALDLACRVRALDESFMNAESDAPVGIVITHGTDTMEETAFLIALTTSPHLPVILTGAMRPSTAYSADGVRNLLDAVILADNMDMIAYGPLLVMNGKISMAGKARKGATTSTAAFSTQAIGEIIDPHVFIDRAFERDYETPPVFDAAVLKLLLEKKGLPRVPILYAYQGDDGALVDAAVAQGAKGIVYAGFGNGALSAAAEKAVLRAVGAGIPVLRATRESSGIVTPRALDERLGTLPGISWSPAQLRVFLTLASLMDYTREDMKRFLGI
ncbi:asparaginase AnsZ [Selenomonas sp. TAMA-11512]|uniref:asparaginase n=1 Tax=Selenomonas sp. TAMA-11512 TaxID=3095337 RepID=UPI00308F28A7|nr:asparaginase AnsZ [Selenomonas sp. TAMA-11512]